MLADGLLDQLLSLRNRSPGVGVEHLLFHGGMDRELLDETVGDLAPGPHRSVPEALITPEQLIDGGVVGFDQRDDVLLASRTSRLPARPAAIGFPLRGRPRPCGGFGGHRHTSSWCASTYPTASPGETRMVNPSPEPEGHRPAGFGADARGQAMSGSRPISEGHRAQSRRSHPSTVLPIRR